MIRIALVLVCALVLGGCADPATYGPLEEGSEAAVSSEPPEASFSPLASLSPSTVGPGNSEVTVTITAEDESLESATYFRIQRWDGRAWQLQHYVRRGEVQPADLETFLDDGYLIEPGETLTEELPLDGLEAGVHRVGLEMWSGDGSHSEQPRLEVYARLDVSADADDHAEPDPVALVGLWEVVDAAGEEPGAVLRLDTRSLRLFRACGGISGDWNALDGLLVASGGSWSGGCTADDKDPTPGWLLDAARHRPHGDGHELLDSDGSVVARLVPTGEPTTPPTIAQSQAAPPTVTEDTRRALGAAAPLPADIEAADPQALLGYWVPDDAPIRSEAHAELDAQVWAGSDGCNGLGGRWRTGPAGALLSTGSGSTDMGCENIPVEERLTRAARAGFDGDMLVLFDRRGVEIARFARPVAIDDPSPGAEDDPVQPDTAAAQRRRFAEAVGADYDATLTVACFCPWDEAHVRIQVRQGEIVTATRLSAAGGGEDLTGDHDDYGLVPIDDIHATIEQVTASGQGSVTARYDHRGVPLLAEVDHLTDGIDDEVTYRVYDVLVVP